jgi:signal transduction histidine kinase
MPEPDEAARYAKLRHDLANPLAAVLAEAQLLLLDAPALDVETRRAIKVIEDMAHKMRVMLMG